MTAKRKSGIIGRILCTLLAMMMFTAMVPISASAAASITLNYKSITLTKGYKATLKASGAKNVKWSSSNSAVASVTSTGKVYAKSAGTAYIYAKSGNNTAKCRVNVVNGKLKVTQSTIYVTEGEYETITVNAVGSHSIKAESSDKSIAKASWIQPWSGNNITLKITGVSEGTATIKVLMSKYTNIYKNITVYVEAAEQEVDPDDGIDTPQQQEEKPAATAHLMTDKTATVVTPGTTDTIRIYTDNKDKVTAVSSDTGVVTVSPLSWYSNYGEYTVTGVKAGTATITISASDNTSLTRTVSVTVTPKGDYYEVCDTEPQKKILNDLILTWVEDGKNKFMLVPASYDRAYTNTIIARSSKKYAYYEIYDNKPDKLADTDTVSSFDYTVGGKTVVRYLLLPKDYDAAKQQTAMAKYTGTYRYWIVYTEKPIILSGDDVIKTWTASVEGQLVTRYILLPKDYDTARFENIKKKDAASTNNYYTIAADASVIVKQADNDTIESFRYVDAIGAYKTAYILLPKDYDAAQKATAIAKYTGTYEYFVVYTESPKKVMSTDVVKSWKKVVNNQAVNRYVLLPSNYTEDEFNKIRDKDVANGGSLYYTVFTSVPSYNASAGETVYTWINPKTGTRRYMILPANYSIVKRNDAVFSDTNVYEYYRIYSTKPSVKTEKDTIYPFTDTTNGACYILLPENYSPDKLNQAMNGQDVTV